MAEVAAPGIADAVIDLTQERIDTYNAFYRSNQADVYDGRYSGLMNAYKVAIGLQGDAAVAEGRTLLGNILQTKELPQAVLMLLPSDKKLLLVHRLYYFPKPHGMGNLRLRKRFCLLGEKSPYYVKVVDYLNLVPDLVP